jgi:hypothetical protein
VGVLDDSRDRQGRSVGLGLEESLEDNLVELGVGSSSKEAVKLRAEGRVRGRSQERKGNGLAENRDGMGFGRRGELRENEGIQIRTRQQGTSRKSKRKGQKRQGSAFVLVRRHMQTITDHTYLHEQEKVGVLRLGGLPSTLLDVLVLNVDTLRNTKTRLGQPSVPHLSFELVG